MSIRVLSKTLKPFTNVSTWERLIVKRFKTKCAPYDDPKCSKKTLAKEKPCPSKIRRLEAKEELPKNNSMWENPECCKDPCPEFYPRFDELYYETSDKMRKKYQQTWVSCPKLQIRPKKLCVHEKLKFPPMEKRPRREKPKTACGNSGCRLCMDKGEGNCPKIVMFGCRAPRTPPKCKKNRSISDCLKECTPYPSFSECMRNKPDPLHPIECKCLNHPMMCEVWAEMRRRMTIVKG